MPLQKQADKDLFTLDSTGDAASAYRSLFDYLHRLTSISSPIIPVTVRRSLPRKLTHAQKVLATRSAVPALHVNLLAATPTNAAMRRSNVSYQEKQRLLRIAGRMSKGPFGSMTDPREQSKDGVGLPMEVARKADRDVWMDDEETAFVERNKLKDGEQKDYLMNIVYKPKVKVSPPQGQSKSK